MKKVRNRKVLVCCMVCLLVCLSSCTKMDEDYKTPTTQKGIIIVNPDKIVK